MKDSIKKTIPKKKEAPKQEAKQEAKKITPKKEEPKKAPAPEAKPKTSAPKLKTAGELLEAFATESGGKDAATKSKLKVQLKKDLAALKK